jgi:hypothetical protein
MDSIFDKSSGLGNTPYTANVCLHRKHLGQGVPPYRLGMTAWYQGYPWVFCRLSSSEIIPNCHYKPFAFAPELSHSIISLALANYFRLPRISGVAFRCPQPLAHYAGIPSQPISATRITKARVRFDTTADVEPAPGGVNTFAFWISDTVEDDFAAIGRNIMERLVLVYRGSCYDGIPSGTPRELKGEVYFGDQNPAR